jgi:hypothetical protein
MLGSKAASFEIGDLPIVPSNMRSTVNFNKMRKGLRDIRLRLGKWQPKPGSGWELIYRLIRTNWFILLAQVLLAAVTAILFYTPALFLRLLINYLEADPERIDRGWGWVYAAGLFIANATVHICKTIVISSRAMIHSLSLCSHGPALVNCDDIISTSLEAPIEFCLICQDSRQEGHRVFYWRIVFRL